MEHPEKDWSEDLRIERTKKRRLKKKKKSRGTVTVSQREKSPSRGGEKLKV